jgi:hypothetical protein
MTFVGTPTEIERLRLESQVFKAVAKSVSYGLRVSLPGKVKSFDSNKQTVSVDLAIKERITINNVTQDITIPTLLDVPIGLPRSGGYALTMPVTEGTECWVIFGDRCINTWWANGGVGVQERFRAHSLSDGYALLGVWSQPNVLSNYDNDKAILRTDDKTVFLGIDVDGIVTSGSPVSASYLNISASLPIKINGTTYYIKLSSTP